MYLINGDVADRGRRPASRLTLPTTLLQAGRTTRSPPLRRNACEILLCIFTFMLAAPGTIHMNRGNHESLDMNVRSARRVVVLPDDVCV